MHSAANKRNTARQKKAGHIIPYLYTTIVLIFAIAYTVYTGLSGGLFSSAAANMDALVSYGSVSVIKTAASAADIADTRELMLVNSSNPAGEEEALTVSAYGRIALSRSNIEIHPSALEAAVRMFQAAAEDDVRDMLITSAYRSFEQQQGLYERAEDKNFVQPAGSSEHQTGLAVDIQLLRGGMNELGKTKQGRWLAKSSWKHGFILRYPEDKTALTGIAYEPWHFRYVGLPHAAYMQKENLCLEEYIKHLSEIGSYTITLGKEKYYIYYTALENGFLQLPAETEYSVSSDNCGGYIVTVKL